MVEIIFEAHGTSFDNESGLASGWNDVALSPLGEKQAKELGERYKGDKFAAIFCSALQRSYRTGELAFGDKFPIIRDARLNECNYGDLTQGPGEKVGAEKLKRINTPFPNGESYTQTTERMRDFLSDISKKYDGQKIMIIGHRATQYGLENIINKIPLETVISQPWKWQPGWLYQLENVF
ncbi:MAG: histidine phosphatase family protein [Patescibacteria group bacterium]|nr:phosphoglycerate mutase family protein [Patescibacteria group bacterium]MDE2015470.1 histidine phosphatase family protein [Patescibacteria group bacterium]MDE2226914.1 histidine phosphatase family protein [Patescibacteria group bacterium]